MLSVPYALHSKSAETITGEITESQVSDLRDYLKFQTFYLRDPARVPGEILLGGYYSILETGKETRGEDSFNIRQNYSDTDYGLLLGYQLKINVQGRLIVKPGLRFNYNMRNIFEGDNIVPSYLKKTNSFSAGFNISVAYKIF